MNPSIRGPLKCSMAAIWLLAFSSFLTPLLSATEPKSAKPVVSGIADAVRSGIMPAGPGGLCDFQAEHDPAKPLIVLVPGLLATESSMNSVRDALCIESFGTSVFQYPSNEGIIAGATRLSAELRRVETQFPDRSIILVTHSMGGLVSRACVEDVNLKPANVSRLIMIAPPNHGSAVASLSADELAKKFTLPNGIVLPSLGPIDEAIGGFVGVARDELRPDSAVLAALNANPIPPQISYCIIAGTGGPVQGELVEMSLAFGDLIFGQKPEAKESLDRVAQLARLDEWTRGRGDGVVSVKAARLLGVTDVVELPFGHNDFGTETTEVTTQVIAEVLRRLEPAIE